MFVTFVIKNLNKGRNFLEKVDVIEKIRFFKKGETISVGYKHLSPLFNGISIRRRKWNQKILIDIHEKC